MTERKICGFDINGWRDIVARNWSTLPGGEENIGPTSLIESGPLTSVVRVGDNRHGSWVGGRQADLAPHGLGDGWGLVGAEALRHSLRDLLEGRAGDPACLAAPFDIVGRASTQNVVAIDDTPETGEAFRERLLMALGSARLRNPMLVWRSVLAALYAIDTGLIDTAVTVGVFSQAPTGLSVQRLRLRHAEGRGNRVLAPERRHAAQVIESGLGYDPLVARARDRAKGPNGFGPNSAHRAWAASVGRLALGLPCRPEVLRQPNGDWESLTLEGDTIVADARTGPDLPPVDDCSLVLVETLSEGPVRAEVAALVDSQTTAPIHVLPSSAVAAGALAAARRLGDGDPVYFDFLPRISTIVFGAEGAANFDLIDADETLVAGRVYRSPQPASFAIPVGHERISVYLRKEAEPHPRKASVTLDAPLTAPSPVQIWVEQTPAAGRARIVLDAQGLGRHFTLDWDEAADDMRSWGEIITDHAAAPPAIPQRLVLKNGMRPWEDSDQTDGLFSLLDVEATRDWRDWDSLAAKLSSRPFGDYCISSDGEIPPEVPATAIAGLDQLTDEARAHNHARLDADRHTADRDNATLKFLTWQFRRCPPLVADWLVDAVESRGMPMFEHPFVQHPSSWVLVYQGLGRIIRDEATERRVLHLLMATDLDSWNWRVESACMSFLLSRSETAPMLLERRDVERLAGRTVQEFRANLRTKYTTFNYAPFLLGGLLRWRLKEKRALLLGEDPLADKLAEAIDRTVEDLRNRRRVDHAFERKRTKYLPLLKDLRDYLEGSGGNPNLLLDIYNAG